MKNVFLFLLFLDLPTHAAGKGPTWLGGPASTLGLGEHVVTFALIGLLLVCLGALYRFKLRSVPDIVIPDDKISLRSFCELYGGFIYRQCREVIGEDGASKYFPFIATTFIFILFSNLIGLVPGFLAPTEHFSTAFALGVFSFCYYNIQGCREQGTLNYIKHFAGPLWSLAILMFPIEVVSNFVRPLTLGLRLKNNMMGDHLILSAFSDIVPILVPIVFMLLGLLVSLIQAYVFTVLTMVYIRLASHHDHGEGGHH